jgi:hypothetical protein
MLKLLSKVFTKIPVKLRWPAFVILAFASFGSFITVDSAWADKHHANTFCIVLGVVLALIVVGIAVLANNENKPEV